jgi:acyl carrier protein
MNPQLKESLAEVLAADPETLTRDAVLRDLDGWDSVAVLSIMVVLGEGLNCEIEPEDIMRLQTFGDIEDLAIAKAA